MKTVSMITTNSRIPNFFAYPLKMCCSQLMSRSYDVKFHYTVRKRHLHSDILGLTSNYFTTWWDYPDTVFQQIDIARRYADKIVWFDDNDSTRVTHFELLPSVDLYLKKQLLKDKTLYAQPLYGDRLFTDYYHKQFGINDVSMYQSKPLDLKYEDKIHLSWHIGLGDMVGDILPRAVKFIKNYLPPKYPNSFVSPSSPKSIDVMFRGTRNYARQTVAFHRVRIGELLDSATQYQRALAGKVSITQYNQECRKSKIMVSPFGWGEIGVRDFQCWYYGAALMKPDMTHMETWPDVFIPDETYYPLNWNFNNLLSGLEELLGDTTRCTHLAEAGQETFRQMTSTAGLDAFCDWFIQQIEK